MTETTFFNGAALSFAKNPAEHAELICRLPELTRSGVTDTLIAIREQVIDNKDYWYHLGNRFIANPEDFSLIPSETLKGILENVSSTLNYIN
ncbi:hypothetical protein AWB71_05307 [Caballeronia peredens]|nr:hypothetical protein AWB71_05307 [Caballeronia peredens]